MQVDNAAKLEMSRRAELLNSRPLNKVGNSLSWVNLFSSGRNSIYLFSKRLDDLWLGGWWYN